MEQKAKPWVRNSPAKYQWRKTVSLTKKEGAEMENILHALRCENVSQFCKKVVNKELLVTKPN